ncbi:hypothetical protein [Kocuria flava]|uniref:hypothetical protein n=1 Tax=Kocuria flava TaxID=446860 RepID=UPI002F921E95
MASQGQRPTTGPPQRFPVPPDGYQLLYTGTCTKCGAKEPTFSIEGRFPRHCSPVNGRSVCVRSGAEFLPGEMRRVTWRVVPKIAVPEAAGRSEPPRTRRSAMPTGNRKTAKTGRSPGKATTATGAKRKVPRLEVERRYYSSDIEEASEARYREWQELNTGSVSVVARPCAPQGTGRRR